MAERFGLNHVSQGTGKERFIVVSKPSRIDATTSQGIGASRITGVSSVNFTNDIAIERGKRERNNSADDKPFTPTLCDKCKKEIPAENLQLHELRCKGVTQKAVENKDVRPKSTKTTKKKSKNKANKLEKEEEDFDTLIAAAIKENSTCAASKCKVLTATLGQNCTFCGKRFCLEHHIPEVHGCGADAKAQARRMISREGVLYSGSGVPNKKPDTSRRAHLQRKLDSKLEEMTQKRKLKKKDENK